MRHHRSSVAGRHLRRRPRHMSLFFRQIGDVGWPIMEGDDLTALDPDEPDTNEPGPAGPARSDTDPGQPQPQKRKGGWRRSWLTELVVLAVVALVVALTVKTFIVQPFKIPSVSMEDTLLVNDRVLVNKLVGRLSQIHRGDIVVFDGAGSWDPPVTQDNNIFARFYRDVLSLFGNDSGETDYIKRVIGLPGDHVKCCDASGQVTVNGVPLQEGSYLYPGSAPSTIRFSITVPPGRLWVMGDNRGDSQDSRLYHCGTPGAICNPWNPTGTIPENMVIGRAFLVVWPPSRFKVLWVPSTFGQAMPQSEAAAVAAARVVPASPALPLSAGVIAAIPVALAERRIRLRRRRRPPAA
jgi:signal peptidase I